MVKNENVLPVGTVLHNGKRIYKVEEVLGIGGFGITYKVSTTVLVDNVPVNTFFAMKEYFMSSCYRDKDNATMLFSPTMKTDVEESLNDFITEAKRLNALGLKSDNIVKVNEVFKENGTAYYIMEYLEGGNLQEFVRKRGALSEKEAIAILTPIAHAMEVLHSERILHLDIKPENIVLKKDPITGKNCPVLIDFGLVKHFDSKGIPTTRLAAKGASDGFAPIEQYTTIDSFAPTLDVYALGATLYCLLKGKNPPKAFDIESSKVIRESLPSEISEKTRNAIVAAMDKNRFERTPSVSALWASLSTEGNVIQQETSIETKKLRRTKVVKFNWKKFSIGITVMIAVGAVVMWTVNNDRTEQIMDSQELKVKKPASGTLDDSPITTITVNGVSFNMVRVDGGTFTMGATAEQGSDAKSNEKPAHQVTLSTYSIGETEVTQALWQAVMSSNPSNFKGDQKPVEKVSWDDCQKFIRKLNQLTGRRFRLPTEAEWEYAARGGHKTKSTKYSGSNNIANVAWYDKNAWDKGSLHPDYGTHIVKTKQANELGLYDMSGNVWEWCQDWFGGYGSRPQTNPTGAASGSYHVCRGGCWLISAYSCRSSRRGRSTPAYRDNTIGLRLALQ